MAEKSTSGVRDRATSGWAVVHRFRSPAAGDVRTVGGGLAAVAVCALAAVRVGLNAPLGQSPAGLQFAHALASTAAVLVPAGAAVALGTVADTEWAFVGLVAAGVFAILATISPVASLPAIGILLLAGLLVAVPTLIDEVGVWSRPLFAGLVVTGVFLSLGANVGLFAPSVRSLGTSATLVALVVAPVAVGVSRFAWFVGGGAAVAVVAGSVAAPFVAGAVFLTVGAAIDPNVIVAAACIGGGVAVVAEGTRRRRVPIVAAGLLLLAAGVPATVPRGLAVVLGAHLLLVSPESPAANATTRGDSA